MPLLGFPRQPRFATSTPQPPAVDVPAGAWLTDTDAPWKARGLTAIAVAAILATDLVPGPLPITSTVASASSSQVAINTWSVYDPTTGPVRSPAVDTPSVLSDDAVLRKQRRNGALASSTAEPVFLPGPAAPPQVLPDDPIFRRLTRRVVNEGAAAPVGVAPGQFLANFVPQWSEQFQLFPRKANKAAAASSTADPILATPAAAVTIVGSSSSAIVRHSWSIHDQTTGPVLPPAAPARTLVDSQSDIRPVRRSKIFLPLPTSIVIAIPIDDLWFESLDVPVRIKGKGKLEEIVQPLSPPAVVVAPPTILSDGSAFRRLRGKFVQYETSAPVGIAPGQFLSNFVAQWTEQASVSWRKPNKASAASSIADPIFTTPIVATVFVSQWLGQSDPIRIKWNKAANASATIDPIKVDGQFLPNFLPHWGEQFVLAKRKWQKGIFDPISITLRPPPSPVAPSILGANWLEHSLTTSSRRKVRWQDAAFPFSVLVDYSHLVTPSGRRSAVTLEVRSVIMTAEARSSAVDAENRSQSVAAENRSQSVDVENRSSSVTAET